MSTSDKQKFAVMVVDDDSYVRSIVSDMLSTLGARTIIQAGNGRDAIAMVRAGPAPDLILCDLHMPGSDGFQFMEELGDAKYKGGIVLISGQKDYVLHSGELMARFHQLNILGALEKPATMAQLRSILTRLGL